MRPLARVLLVLALFAHVACSVDRSLGTGPIPPPPTDKRPSQPPTPSVQSTAGSFGSSMGRAPPPSAAPRPVSFDQTGADNPAGLPKDEVQALLAGGPLGDMRWLYPYDGTVFPGGSIAPLVMWTGNLAADAVYLHMKSQLFEYRGVLKPSFAEGLFIPMQAESLSVASTSSWKYTQQPQKQLVIPQFAWDAAAARTLGSRDPLLLEVSARVNGVIYGPVSSRIVIARGAVQGSIYYNSCYFGSATDPGVEQDRIGARVMRIPPRGNAEVVSSSKACIGCHAVAANGSRLVAQRAFGIDDTADRALNPGQPAERHTHAVSLPLRPDAKPDPLAAAKIGIMGAYGALYPDGSKYLAASGRLDAGFLTRASELLRPPAASLIDAITGEVVLDTGIPADATMPMFSPDGRQLVFTDASTNGYRIAVMDYDPKNHKASAYRPLVENDPSKPFRPGWPAFLPDGRGVIFVQTDSENFSSQLTVLPTGVPATSDLYVADLATGKVTLLARAMGFDDEVAAREASTYLPYRGMDMHRNHFPTVSPAAAGGYFWVFFDSVRNFGSMGPMRTLWGAAIDIHPDGSYTTDPSHPPFYVPGQEFMNTGHFRAFAALNRCNPDGDTCLSGIDCCGGVCTDAGVCGQPTPNTCARRQERCDVTADCCDSADYCINSFCSLVELL